MPRRVRVTLETTAPYGIRSWCSRLANALVDRIDPGSGRYSVILVDDETITGLNRETFGIDGPTDVLSFPLQDESGFVVGGRGNALQGELVIAIPTAQRQAAEHDHSLKSELAHLLVHGLLHIQGMDHDGAEDRAVMEEAEGRFLREALAVVPSRDRAGIVVPHEHSTS